ncbi:MAG: DNA adenine methylase [Clostridia bacterium]|nr:DNA adenine methylase [Clostridia bacterium]
MNYIGSKYSLMDFLTETIVTVAGTDTDKIFADLFAGTGVVGKTFKQNGYQVIANDIQHYSYVTNKHFIENVPPLDASIVEYLNALKGTEGFIYKNYCAGSGSGRNYFTDQNGMKCDSIRIELELLKNSGEINEAQYYYLLASLINSIDKYANTASVYGAFLKHVKKSAQREFELELLPIIDGDRRSRVYNEDIAELIKRIHGDILYLDPPYNERQYCANYHVLETISRYDFPELKGKTGLRDYSSQKSDFCSSKTVVDAFEHVIRNSDFQYIFLSYNNEGLMPFDVIKGVMEKYGEYEMFCKDYRRFKADTDENRNHKSDKTVEYLHCLVKK